MESAKVDSGLADEDLPKRARESDPLPFGDPDLDKIPEKVLDLEPRNDGLAGRNGIGVSGDSSTVVDLALRTSSDGRTVLPEGWFANPSPCEVMDYRRKLVKVGPVVYV